MSSIYEIDISKYNGSFDAMQLGYSSFLQTFHTCPELMIRKKKLEKIVWKTKNKVLKKHFRLPFRKRKKQFYQKIIYDIFEEGQYIEDREMTELEIQASEITKDILFIYSKKEEEKEMINDAIEHIAAEIDHRQEMRESLIEEWRGID
tara:strand:+ start:87 stop:530 length:444 start_codon:yes stop_codon:yes gene_type:complete